MTNPLPSDPDNKNSDRADWSEAALKTFMDQTGTDPSDAIADLIGDLRHLCDRKPEIYGEFEIQIRRGLSYYEMETAKVDEEDL